MKPIAMNRSFALVASITVLALVTMACACNLTDNLVSKVSQKALGTAQQAVEEAEQPVQTVEVVEEEPVLPTVEEPVEEERPTPKPVGQGQPARIVKSGFGQDGTSIGLAFLVENPNPNLAIRNLEYRVAAYDDTDTVQATSTGYVGYLPSGETTGIANSLYVTEGINITRIDIKLEDGLTEEEEQPIAFPVDKVSYRADDYNPTINGVVTNPFDSRYINLALSGILYNEAGEIIGSGYSFLNFIEANSSLGVSFYPIRGEEPDHVEIYVTYSGYEDTTPPRPSGTEELRLVQYGYGVDQFSSSYALILENSNPDYALIYTQYYVSAYDEEGYVVNTTWSSVGLILPGQTLATSASGSLPQNATIARMDVQVMVTEYRKMDAVSLFTTENAKFTGDQYSKKITGVVVSPYDHDVPNVNVVAVGYDSAGNIIGSGYTWLDFVPAGARAAVEVYIYASETPARVELYAYVSDLTSLGE
jgi:hypothetical protein